MWLETIAEKLGYSSCFVKLFVQRITVLMNILKIDVVQTLNVFGNNSRKHDSSRYTFFVVFINESQFREHIKTQMFPRPYMCLATIAERKWLIKLICLVFIQWITVLRNIFKNQCFPEPKCVWTQKPKTWLVDVHDFFSFYIMNHSSGEHIKTPMFSRPYMCLATIAERKWFIELICLAFYTMNYSS